uniref:Uncharacterized protein n=1 Tax=Arundo donax TaxID=35708 RepID=A0A0A9G4T3_ARUDO
MYRSNHTFTEFHNCTSHRFPFLFYRMKTGCSGSWGHYRQVF